MFVFKNGFTLAICNSFNSISGQFIIPLQFTLKLKIPEPFQFKKLNSNVLANTVLKTSLADFCLSCTNSMMNSSVESCVVTNDLIPYIRKCGVKTRADLAELVQSKPDDMPLQVAYQTLVDIEKKFNEYTAEVSNNCCLFNNYPRHKA